MSAKKQHLTRREFTKGAVVAVTAGAAATAGAVPPAESAATPTPATPTPAMNRAASRSEARQRNVLHIIGHSHIDAAWLWPWRDGESEAINTFRSALDRMEEFPEFRFSHSSAVHYRWLEKADPQMLAEIRSRIREGRWEVVGGWPVEPDCNIPATESFIRHCLYGKLYLRRSLGVDVSIGFNPDSFGHAAGLPTILTRAGYGYYVFQRPGDSESTLPHLFWWEGPDGSRVLTNRIWRYYDDDADGIPKMLGRAFAEGNSHATFFLGVGDHGGAVTKQQIAQVLALRADPKMPELRFSTLGDFFSALEKSGEVTKLPVVRGELQHHARGCYSAYGEGKYQNRRAERSLLQAEAISVVGSSALGHDYPGELYAESWWKVLFCQFHDMLAGSSQYSDYQDVRDSLGFACEAAQTNQVEVLEALARSVDTRGIKEGAVFVFNPLPWARKALLEYTTDNNPSGHAPITHLRDQSGRRVDLQWRPPGHLSDGPPRLCAAIDLPPLGYRVFELAHELNTVAPEHASDRYRNHFATPSEVGFGISSLRAPDGTELLAGLIGLVVLSDTSDTWGHGVRHFRNEIGRPQLESSAVIEEGTVVKVTRHRALWRSSEIMLDIMQFAGLEAVELRFVINWHEHEQMLKLEIPTVFANARVYAKVPGAILERRADGDEEPYQDWLALEGRVKRASAPYVVALINNSTYSYDCLNGLLRTVLIRSGPFARHDPMQVSHGDVAWQDQGRQERRFWLLTERGSYTDMCLDRRAEELQTPAEYVADSAHRGTAPWRYAFLDVSPANVWVLAIKREEAGRGTVIRLQERMGRQTSATLRSVPLSLDHQINLAPWEIKTLLVHSVQGKSTRLRVVSTLES